MFKGVKKVKFQDKDRPASKKSGSIRINHDKITSDEFKARVAAKQKATHKDKILLEEMEETDIDTIVEFLQNDDDLQTVREFLYGAKDWLKSSFDNVKNMFKKLFMHNEELIPMKVSILTPYKMTIPIGTVMIAKKKSSHNWATLHKFYIAKIWWVNG